MNEDNKVEITLPALLIMILLIVYFISQAHYWHYNFEEATELYCKSKYNNTLEYEQCKRTDLIILLQAKEK